MPLWKSFQLNRNKEKDYIAPKNTFLYSTHQLFLPSTLHGMIFQTVLEIQNGKI